MAQSVGIWQKLAVTTAVWCLFSLPSFCISPINNVLKYLACVVIYPKVRLTWSGVMACFTDLRMLLEGRIYLNIILFYVMVWWVVAGCRRLARSLRPPQGINACWNSKAFWEYTKQCTSYLPYQGGYYTWRDMQVFWSNQLSREYWSYRRSDMIQKQMRRCLRATSRIVDVVVVWSGTRRLIGKLHSKTQALVWRLTSYNVRLHVRFWSYVANCVFRMVIANPERYLIGAHTDILEQHVLKFLFYRSLPLRCVSRLWGQFNSLHLPVWLRPYAYGLYIRMFGCSLEEATITDLKHYKNLGEFFRRSLKPHLRPVDMDHDVTSPVDGTVVYSGQVSQGLLEQIKGVTYSLVNFIGEDVQFMEVPYERCLETLPASTDACQPFRQTYNIPRATEHEQQMEYFPTSLNINLDFSCGQISDEAEELSKCHFGICGEDNPDEENDEESYSPDSLSLLESDFATKLVLNNENVLYQCIIYLAPGDYHRFHSPVDWTVHHRRHFLGNLFSVKPTVSSWLQGVLVLNERVMYTGRWKHGFFSMTAVGATNVGSINVFFDQDLQTNEAKPSSVVPKEVYFNGNNAGGIPLERGELFGEFNLGSTVVLVFEAPPNFSLRVGAGDRVKYGQGLVTSIDIKHGKRRKSHTRM